MTTTDTHSNQVGLEPELEPSRNVVIDGWCDCGPGEHHFEPSPCGGCEGAVRPYKIGVNALHWQGKHWHVSCAFQNLYTRSRVSSAASVVDDATIERNAVLGLIERFQREPGRSQGAINALEWLRRDIEAGNHAHHAFVDPPPGGSFLKPEECFRCQLPRNTLMHMAHVTTASPLTPTVDHLLRDAGIILIENNNDAGARVVIRFSELRDAQRLHRALLRARATWTTENATATTPSTVDEAARNDVISRAAAIRVAQAARERGIVDLRELIAEFRSRLLLDQEKTLRITMEKHRFQRGGPVYDQMCGLCNAVADADVHQMGDIERAEAANQQSVGKRCVKCRHGLLPDALLNDLGKCTVQVVTPDGEADECGCRCIFPPAPEAQSAGERIVREFDGLIYDSDQIKLAKAINAAISRAKADGWQSGMRDAAKEICDACDNEERYRPAGKIQGSTRWWHGEYPCDAGAIWHVLEAAAQSEKGK